MALRAFVPSRHRGASLVETMVGILIGMIVIAVVYNILSVAEGYKRATVGSSDAQITGLLTQFMASRDISNGGNGIMMATTQMNTGGGNTPSDLSNCNDSAGNPLVSGDPNDIVKLGYAVRPIPVIIFDNYNGTSDSFISLSANAAHVIWPVDVIFAPAPAPQPLAGLPITVQSPTGFTVPPPTPARPYWAVAINNNDVVVPKYRCQVFRVIGAVPDPAVPPTGRVTLTQDPALKTGFDLTGGTEPPRVLVLGPQGLATRILYDLDQAKAVLRTTDLLTTDPNPLALAVPIAQNVVLMKAQYGVDLNNDGTIDCWTPADNSTCGDFSPAAVIQFPLRGVPGTPGINNILPGINSILAVRIGVVVRSDEPDLRALTDPGNADLQAEARALRAATRPPVVLFNCSTNNAACQNRVVVAAAAGAPVGSSSCGAAVICDYWRYRTYETIVPLRNSIYAATIP